MNAKQITKKFNKDLKDLLKKYNAEIQLYEIQPIQPYLESEYTIMVYIPEKNNDKNEVISEYIEINLGTFIDKD